MADEPARVDQPAVEAFIDAYRRTFESFDVDAIAARFAFPCQVTGEGDTVTVTVVTGLEAWRPQVERIVRAYRLLGVASATIDELRVVPVTPHVAQALVRWGLVGADAASIYAFTACYTLVDAGDGPRITAIVHDETPKLAAAVARHRAG